MAMGPKRHQCYHLGKTRGWRWRKYLTLSWQAVIPLPGLLLSKLMLATELHLLWSKKDPVFTQEAANREKKKTR